MANTSFDHIDNSEQIGVDQIYLVDTELESGSKSSCGKRTSNFFKSIDKYGIPVGLMYKSEPEIRSVVGGVATVLARVIILAFLCISANKSSTRTIPSKLQFLGET